MSNTICWVAGITGIALAAVITAGNIIEPFYPTGLSAVLSSVGGKIMTLDFTAALLLIGVWIFRREQDKRLGALFLALVVILGTPVALLYIAFRGAQKSES